MVPECDFMVKTLLVGNSGVGKSSLMLRFIENKFEKQFMCTVGVDYKTIYTNVNNNTVKLLIWDTAGQERFKAITKVYYKGANAVIFVYDVTDRNSFENIPNWLKEITSIVSEDFIKILVGTKSDIDKERKVNHNEGIEMALTYSFDNFFETSSKTDLNVEETFLSISSLAISKNVYTKKTNNTINLSKNNLNANKLGWKDYICFC